MVKIILLLFVLTISGSMYAQTDSLEDDYLIMIVDQAPLYKISENGQKNIVYSDNKLKDFIVSNLNYAGIDINDAIKGIVYISFWIDTARNTYDHKVIRGLREDLNNEALRIAKLIRFEKPAMQRGKLVTIRYTVPVGFELQGKEVRKCKQNFAYCQQDSIQEMGYSFEEPPVFKGDQRMFVQKNIIYPNAAIIDSIEGKVYVKYLVDTSGVTKKHEIEKGIRDDLNKEAIRVARLIKYDNPAKLRGKPVLFYSTLPIEFKLSAPREMY